MTPPPLTDLMGDVIKTLYEKATGTPWTTVRSCTEEFGPTVAVEHAETVQWWDGRIDPPSPAEVREFADLIRPAEHDRSAELDLYGHR